MELAGIEMERSKEGTGLGADREFPLGHVEFEMSLNIQRRYEIGSGIYESRVQGGRLG